MRTALVLLALAAAAHAVQPGGQPVSFLEAGETPMEKVPVVGEKFKVNPVSTSMQCVISLTIQYMIVYTALALCRTAADVFNIKYDNLPIQDILKTATYTVNFAPMLAILFLGCRMRVTWLTQGKGNPPEYVQVSMYCATCGALPRVPHARYVVDAGQGKPAGIRPGVNVLRHLRCSSSGAACALRG